jgi:hypothetical protein
MNCEVMKKGEDAVDVFERSELGFHLKACPINCPTCYFLFICYVWKINSVTYLLRDMAKVKR